MAWRVEVDEDTCMGTGACEYTAPDVFEVGDEGVVKIIGPVPEDDKKVRDAVAECPVGALKLLGPDD
ncbi:MAG: ferredoxin [Streptosporangiales bacterium]|nr:ferredoxin [Streptosporangiales bacterium]